MKVLFLEDVSGVADAGETREVAEGYGRNYLLPRKLAVRANSQASSVVEAHLKKIAGQKAQFHGEMQELAGQIAGKELVFKVRAGAKGKLYGSITQTDIAEELSKSAGYEIDKRKVEMEEPIHNLGSYEVNIRLAKDIIPVIKVNVVGEGEKQEEPEKEQE